MFDYVNYEANCQRCGEKLSNFQTKDSECNLQTIEPSECDFFYTACYKCKAWHDFTVERECVVKNIQALVRD